MTDKPRWMDGAVVYQIYPRSFYDTNSDGIGDLPGIIAKLDYLQALGVDAIWLSPFYPSPMADFGYDIKDYCDVEPLFGTLDDARQLINQAHQRDIRLMVDLVPNHTSDEHDWFIESASSQDNPKHDWYIWRDAIGHSDDGQPLPPNNWIEVFSGGSAWQWHDARQQFYLHSFNVHQPDLNWENSVVRDAIQDVMRFWLDLGVDGFRVDAINFIAKDLELRDDPINEEHAHGRHPRYNALRHIYSQGTDVLFDYMQTLITVLQAPEYANRQPFMVSEAYPQTTDHVAEYAKYYQRLDPAVAAPFNFEGLEIGWYAAGWKDFLPRFQTSLEAISSQAVMSYAFGNHDQPRLASRLGDPIARAAAVLLLSLPGMAFIYNGDELGMRNGIIPPEFVKDPDAQGGIGRDPERTPLQWSAEPNAGFTDGPTTWLPVNDDYPTRNIANQTADAASYLTLYRQLIHVRRLSKPYQNNNLTIVPIDHPELLAMRWGKNNLTVINFSDQPVSYPLDYELTRCLVSSQPDSSQHEAPSYDLAANEAVVFQIAL